MVKEITLFAKTNFFEIDKNLNEADFEYPDGFIVTIDIPVDENLSVEKIAERFGEKAKEAFKVFAYGGDTEKKKLQTSFIEIFGENIKK